MIRSTRAIAASATIAAALVGLAACGSKTVAPQQQLDNSFSGLASKSSLTSTVRFALSPADLTYFAGMDSDDDAATKARLLKLIPTSSLVLTTATTNGKALKTVTPGNKDDDISVAFILGGKSDVEVRAIGSTNTLYARADVHDLAAQTGTANPNSIDGELSQLPASLSFLKPAAAGGWLNIDLGSLEALAKQFPGAGSGAAATPNPSQATAAEAQLIDSLERDVTATQGPASNLGDHLILTANSKTVATDVVGAIKSLVPPALQSQLAKMLNVSTLPSREVTIDEYTKGGVLSALQIDLAQFATGADAAKVKGHHIPLELDFTSGGATVSAPATSTNVNLQEIIRAFESGTTTS